MNDAARDRFDALLQDVIDSLPPHVHALLDEIPVVVLDRPTPAMIEDLRREGTLGPDEDGLDLCGLHTGLALTERGVETEGGRLPDQVHLFREGIIALALGEEGARSWIESSEAAGAGGPGDDEVYEEIRITLLHELGHHFGLDEDDLEELGYG